MSTIIERLEFLNEEVIVIKKTKLTKDGATEQDIFTQTRVNQEKGQLIECVVIKVGNKQTELKVGDDVYVREDFLSDNKIKGDFDIKDIFFLQNHKIIFAKCLN